MKTNINTVELYFVVLLFFGFSNIVFSQSFNEDLSLSSSQKNKSLFLKTQLELGYKANSNQVAIVQIGDLNTAIVAKSVGTTSMTEVIQNGDNNYFFSYKDVNSSHQKVVQNGDNNVILDYGKNKSIDVHQNFYQKGANLNIISTGVNSISKDMTIQQIGTSKTISIINL